MANEITVQASLAYANPAAGVGIPSQSLVLPSTQFTITGKNFVAGTVLVSHTAPTTIPVGGLANIGWVMFINRDPTNFLTIFASSGGTALAKLKAGEAALFRVDTTITAPAAEADTADCLMQMLMLEI